MSDTYIYVIVTLLPLVALMLVFQVNPYHALVIRAILGAVAALVYAVLGAADVALTEALVGTMLAITLYVVAVRSSLVMRLGILQQFEAEKEIYWEEFIADLRKILNQHHLRLELVEYANSEALERALIAKEVHGTCTKGEPVESHSDKDSDKATHYYRDQTYHTAIRVRRLFEIVQTKLTSPITNVSYVSVSNLEDKH